MQKKLYAVTETRSHKWAIHAPGCRDLGKAMYPAELRPMSSPQQWVADEVEYYTENGQGWTEDNFRVYPCCSKV